MTNIQKFDFSVDLKQSLLWQYDDAKHLQALIEQKNAWYEKKQSRFWNDWFYDIFNLDTANDFGLSVWAIILDIPLAIGIEGSGERPVWGFGSYNGNFSDWAGADYHFGTNFGRNGDTVFALNIEQKRLILKLRYYQLISRGSVSEVNAMLKALFKGHAHVIDGLDMTMTYIFDVMPSSQTLLVLEQFDLLPRPAGVKRKILINPTDSFGFKPYYLNFKNSNFHI